MGRRIRWLGVILVLCFALVIVQLINIQFRQASALANSPNNPRVAATKFDNERGTITASDGTVLAKSVKINSSSGTYNYEREYPDGPLYAGITGYYSPYFGAPAGIEYQYNQYLKTHAQPPQNLSQLLFNKPPAEPDNVALTVDPVLQAAATHALQTIPSANKDGAVVVLNPSTGAVLALASNPTFDPNSLANPSVPDELAYEKAVSANDIEGFNGLTPIATEESFFPGSTFKVVTTAAVYNLKPSLINYSFPYAVSISFPDSNKTLSNDGFTACGGTMAVMLPASCDPGYGELGIKLGEADLTQEAKDFGYSVYQSGPQTVPGLDLPHVAVSTISNISPTAQADLAYSAIGQLDDQATPLQNALVAAGIANSGVVMTPHLMSQITDSQGSVVKTYTPSAMSTVTTPAEAAEITKLMQSVAVDGTAAGIFPASWHIAVKTGTAQVQAPSGPEQTDDWMIGFLPAATGASQLAIAVVVPYQAFSLTGAQIAGPIVRQVVAAYLGQTGGQG
jgi:peptidoglycan glycosyltransferase